MINASFLAMRHYSLQPRDWIFAKGYGFLSFAKNIGKNPGKNLIKNLSSKYIQKYIDHTKQSATNALKTSSKSSRSNWWLYWYTIANKIIKV